jgi:5-methylcytosine-specific restriction endonuclease McrA
MLYLYITSKKEDKMSNDELTVMLLDKIGWDYDKILNPGHYSNTEDLFAGVLIEGILSTKGTKEASDLIKFPYKTVTNALEQFFQPQFGKLQGGGETWRFKLLTEVRFKYCSDCKKLLSFESFDLNKSSATGRHHYCKECKKALNAETYKKESTKESHKRSYLKNRDKIKARNALYRAQRDQRSPAWAFLAEIALVYKNCPEDAQVDHIIPLKGNLVSGLHVAENLQYLSPEDNIRKSNTFDIEKYNANLAWYDINTPIFSIRKKYNKTGRTNNKLSEIPCLYCEKVFKPSKFEQSFCSKSCAAKYANPALESKEGYTKEYIETIIWSMPFTKGCKIVGLSDNGLRKMAIRLGCLMPPSHFHVKSEEFKIRTRIENNIKEYKE